MSSRKTRHTCRHCIIRLWFSHHWGLMPLRSVGCMDIYCIDCCFNLDLRLGLSGLLLLNLRAVILIVFPSKFSRNLAVEGSKFRLVHDNSGQSRWWITALPVGVSNSIVIGYSNRILREAFGSWFRRHCRQRVTANRSSLIANVLPFFARTSCDYCNLQFLIVLEFWL